MQIDESLVARLIGDQFPDWAQLAVRPVPNGGHDNRTFRLGADMSVRVPSHQEYAMQVAKEFRWLPALAPHLPLPIPVPLRLGKPGQGLPWQWTVNRWLEGQDAGTGAIVDREQCARDLAGFLNALRSVDAKGGPAAGPHSFYRGGDLSHYDGEARECMHRLRDVVATRAALDVWESALGAAWQEAPVWVHGDVAAGNLLVREGRLSAVIDFGLSTTGDPACDTTIAWTLFRGESRKVFRRDLTVDEGTWARGKGWGLWKAMLQLCEDRSEGTGNGQAFLQVIEDILAD